MDLNIIGEDAKRLSKAVQVVLDPYVDQIKRHEAHIICEDFKNKSTNCAQVGLFLASKENNSIVRHFGMQLIEHTIRFRWNDISPDNKLIIKNSSMQLLANGTFDILTEQTHIKDALSRIIVEMIKREWPQQWPNMLDELSNLCTVGDVQTELVLLILLRLAEDIVAFQNVQTRRRREIFQALTANMTEIFTFFLQRLQTSRDLYTSTNDSKDEIKSKQSLACCRVSQTVLLCLSGFIDWISLSVVLLGEGILLKILCQLLSDRNLQLQAAECLLQFVNRKGKIVDRKPILILFDENMMKTIFIAASSTSTAPFNEHNYLFFKKLCQVMTGLGSQLSSLWGSVSSVRKPDNFRVYLDCMYAFVKHPSQVISRYTHNLWSMFFKHNVISKDIDILSYVGCILSSSAEKLVKIGLPSHSDCATSQYSVLDFDSDEEFNLFFCSFKSDIMETIKLATVLAPITSYNHASLLLKTQLSKPTNDIPDDMCTIHSPEFLQWEATSVFLECVSSRILQSNKQKPSSEDAINLLKCVIDYDTKDPLILSCTLSCISALLVFLTEQSNMLFVVLDKIFATLVFSLPGQTKATRSRAVKNVRRHACSSLVKICKLYPSLVAPCFDQIYTHVKNLSEDPEQLSRMEKCTLVEALVLLSNQFKDYTKQSAFLKDILEPVTCSWLSEEIKQAFANGVGFMAFIGLNKEPVEPSNSDQVGMNRSQITFCVEMMLAVMKRSEWPPDIDEAKSGGFVTTNADMTNILHNPVENHIYHLLENVFHLASALKELWLPEVSSQVCPKFKKAYEITDSDRNNILGITSPPCIDPNLAHKSPIDRMQNFLTTIHDNCYHLLGNAGRQLGHAFYSMPELAPIIVSKLFTNLDAITDYRLRPIVRVFLKSFIQYCPAEFYTGVIIPVLNSLCPYMYQRLNIKWLIIAQRTEKSNEEEENAETQELLEDQLSRQLSRDYIDILTMAMLKKGRATEDTSDQMEAEELNFHRSSQEDSLSELGLAIVESQALPSIIFTLFHGLSWNDTVVCAKSCQICLPVLRQMLEQNKIGSKEACHLMLCILFGLQKHGQHDANQALLLNLGLQAYEVMRPKFPEITETLLEIPNSSKTDLEHLDEKINQENLPKTDKKKRDLFKKIVVEIIGRNVGQIFKRKSVILNLPPIYKVKKKDEPDIIDGVSDALNSLFKL